jgi:hypothetical protein
MPIFRQPRKRSTLSLSVWGVQEEAATGPGSAIIWPPATTSPGSFTRTDPINAPALGYRDVPASQVVASSRTRWAFRPRLNIPVTTRVSSDLGAGVVCTETRPSRMAWHTPSALRSPNTSEHVRPN